MLNLSPDFADALREARFLMAPGRIVRLYSQLRNEQPQLPASASLPLMLHTVIRSGVMNTQTIPIKVVV